MCHCFIQWVLPPKEPLEGKFCVLNTMKGASIWSIKTIYRAEFTLEQRMVFWSPISLCTIFFFFFLILAMLTGMQGLSSPTRNGACAPAVEVQSLNQWTPRKSLAFVCLLWLLLLCFIVFVLPQKSRKRERKIQRYHRISGKKEGKTIPVKDFTVFLPSPQKLPLRAGYFHSIALLVLLSFEKML